MLTFFPAHALGEELDEPDLKEAKGAVLLDSAGNVLYELEPELELPPASTTKVMTAMVALDSGMPLDEEVQIIVADLGDGGQLADYGEGDVVTLGELLEVMLVYSGNDAAYNVACHVAGSEEAFADLMNAKAAELGMEHTHFVNAHGMDVDDHYSCALDLARMGKYAMENYPFICRAVVKETVETTVRGYPTTLNATDRLLGTFPGIRGVKSGAVENNYTFVGAAGRGDIALYSGVVGCTTHMGRFDETATLMDWGYSHYGDYAAWTRDMVVSLHPSALDFGRKVAISSYGNTYGTTWDGWDTLSYSSVQVRQNRLLDPGVAYGWTHWTQNDRPVATTLYGTRQNLVQASSWPIFSTPLFVDSEALGEGMPHV